MSDQKTITTFTDEDIRIIHRAMGMVLAAMTHDLQNRELYENTNKHLVSITMKMERVNEQA